MDLLKIVVDLGKRLPDLAHVSIQFPPETRLGRDGVWRILRLAEDVNPAADSELAGSQAVTVRVEADKLGEGAAMQVLRGGPFMDALCNVS